MVSFLCIGQKQFIYPGHICARCELSYLANTVAIFIQYLFYKCLGSSVCLQLCRCCGTLLYCMLYKMKTFLLFEFCTRSLQISIQFLLVNSQIIKTSTFCFYYQRGIIYIYILSSLFKTASSAALQIPLTVTEDAGIEA